MASIARKRKDNGTADGPCSTSGFSVSDGADLKYEKNRHIQGGLQGTLYQLLLLVLFFVKGHKNGYTFKLATEVKGAGSFDDLVFSFVKSNHERHRLLQAKHIRQGNITKKNLFGETSHKDFDLQKYFSSITPEMKKRKLETTNSLQDLVLFTNRNIATDLEAYLEEVNDDGEDIFNLPHGKKYRLSPTGRNELKHQLEKTIASDEDVETFCQHFVLAVNQPDGEELERIVEQEFFGQLSHSYVTSSGGFRFLKEKMFQWFKEDSPDARSFYLTNDKFEQFVRDAENEMDDIVTLGKYIHLTHELARHEIHFRDEYIEHFRSGTRFDEGVVQIVTDHEPYATALKVLQTVGPKNQNVFIGRSVLVDELDDIKSLLKSSNLHLVVVQDSTEQQSIGKFVRYWKKKRKDNGTQIIFIHRRDDNELREVSSHVATYHDKDDVRWSNLADSSQKSNLLTRRVSFGNRSTTLGDLVGGDQGMQSVFDGSLLREILTQDELTVQSLLGECYGYCEEYYVPRTMEKVHQGGQRHIPEQASFDKDVVDNDGNVKADVSLLHSSDSSQTTNVLAGRVNFENGSTTFDDLEAGGDKRTESTFESLLDKLELLTELMEQSLHGECAGHDESSHIPRTTGIVHHGDQHRNSEQADFNEEDIVRHADKLTVISDCAGMGKSNFLYRLAETIIPERIPNAWVIRVNLVEKRIADAFDKKFPVDVKPNNANDFLVSELLPPTSLLERKILRQRLAVPVENCPLIVMLDALDEIDTHQDRVIRLVQSLMETCVAQVWLATRPHLLDKLQSHFGRSATFFRMKPFSRENQIQFLVQFWLTEGKVGGPTLDVGQVEKQAKRLVEKVNRSIDDRYGQFIGIPLQCRLLAEAFAPKCGDNDGVITVIPDRLHLVDLYKKFIEAKQRIYSSEKCSVLSHTNSNIRFALKNTNREFKSCMMRLAVRLLFDSGEFENVWIATGSEKRFDDILKNKTELHNYGLTTTDGEWPRFLHQTYAEYFAALYIARQFGEGKAGATSFSAIFTRKTLVDHKFQMVRSFLNGIMERKRDGGQAEARAPIEELPDGKSFYLYTAIDTAAREGHIEILRSILHHFGPVEENKTKIKALFGLHERKKNGECSLFDKLCLNENTPETYVDLRDSPLHIAAHSGHSHVVEYMLQFVRDNQERVDPDGELLQIVLGRVDTTKETPLHIAARWGHEHVVRCILEFVLNNMQHITGQILPTLLSENWDRQTPFHIAAEKGHESVVRCILNFVLYNKQDNFRKFIPTLFGVDGNGDSPLHKAAEKGRENVVCCILDSVTSETHVGTDTGLIKTVFGRNVRGQSPLHLVTVRFDTCVEMAMENDNIERLRDALIGVIPDPLRQTWQERSLVVSLDKLIKPLIFVAIFYGDAERLEELSATMRHDVVYMLKGSLETIDLIWNAVKRDGDLAKGALARDARGRMPTIWAAKWGHSQLVRSVWDCVKNYDDDFIQTCFGGSDDSGQTMAHWAAKNGHTTIIEQVIEYTKEKPRLAEALCRPCHSGKTPTQLAEENGHLGIAQLLTSLSQIRSDELLA